MSHSLWTKIFLSFFIVCLSVCFKNSNEEQVRIPFVICSSTVDMDFFFFKKMSKCDKVQKEGALAGIGVLRFIQGLISEFPLPTR